MTQRGALRTSRRGPSLARAAGATLCALLLGLQVGCYTYQPLQLGTPPEGPRVGVVLNDTGRAAVSVSVGPAMELLDGRIVGRRADSVVVSVQRTRDLRGSEALWTGELVAVPTAGIAGYRERSISKGRTSVLVVVAVAAAAFVFNRSLTIFGDARDPQDDGPPRDS